MWGNALSWALLGDDNKISEWDYLNFDISPKMSILSMVDIVADAALQLPSADAYVMESEGYAALGKMKPSIYQFHLMRQQLLAIIISTLKMRTRMNKG
uniref:Uncharacterized protein n=1 Tax=Bracon brevicornis TaxID=1563983 RepID=A0A6V7HLC0_9HYME